MSDIQKDKVDGFVFIALSFLFAIMPITWAFSRELSTLLLELTALGLLGLLLWHRSYAGLIPPMHRYFILGVLGLNLLYMIPLPYDLWMMLPGRDISAQVLQMLPENDRSTWRAISISYASTESSFLLLIALSTIYVASLSLSHQRTLRLVYIILFVAGIQSVIGLMQYGGNIALPGYEQYPGVARGTYLNRDHFAGFLEMVFPVLLALLALHIGHRQVRQSLRQRARFWAGLQGNQALIYAALAVLILLALIFTRSRAGVALFMVGILIVFLVFGRRLGGNNIFGTYGTVVALIIVLAVELGLAPVFDRFAQDPLEDMRWELYATSLTAIADYFPLGSGHGTFSIVYPAYQLPHNEFYVNHLHSDYMEWVFEGGLPMLILIIFGIYLYVVQWRAVFRHREWYAHRFLQAGAGIGVFLMLLHSFIDFNLHKSINAMYFVFLLALFMRQSRGKPPENYSHEADNPLSK